MDTSKYFCTMCCKSKCRTCAPSQVLLIAFAANLFSSSKDKNSKLKAQPKEYYSITLTDGSAGCVVANRLTEIKIWTVS